MLEIDTSILIPEPSSKRQRHALYRLGLDHDFVHKWASYKDTASILIDALLQARGATERHNAAIAAYRPETLFSAGEP